MMMTMIFWLQGSEQQLPRVLRIELFWQLDNFRGSENQQKQSDHHLEGYLQTTQEIRDLVSHHSKLLHVAISLRYTVCSSTASLIIDCRELKGQSIVQFVFEIRKFITWCSFWIFIFNQKTCLVVVWPFSEWLVIWNGDYLTWFERDNLEKYANK